MAVRHGEVLGAFGHTGSGFANGERVFRAPVDHDAGLGLQAEHDGGYIAAVQEVSNKTFVNLKGQPMWPCRFRLLN